MTNLHPPRVDDVQYKQFQFSSNRVGVQSAKSARALDLVAQTEYVRWTIVQLEANNYR